MIPLNEITGSSLDALFVYMALLGILLLAASWLRLKIPLLKKYYIPASLIAGAVSYTHLTGIPFSNRFIHILIQFLYLSKRCLASLGSP